MRSSSLTPRLAHFLSLFMALSLACARSAVPRHPPPSGEIGLSVAASPKPAPFGLVHYGPRDEALADPVIQLAFNRPLRSLGTDADPPSGLVIEPALPGTWQWVGTHGLTFVPSAGRLPRATAFRVDVPASLSSASGETLGQATSFSFVTPRPSVEGVSPSPHSPIGPREPVRIALSTEIQAETLAPFIRVSATEPVPFKVAPDPDSPQTILVLPRTAWPKARLLTVEIMPGWLGSEGSEKAPRSYSAEVRTYGPPRLRLTCDLDPTGRCSPTGWFALQADTPIDARSLSTAVRSREPGAASADTEWWEGATTSFLNLSTKVAPGQTLTVELTSSVRDVYGQPIAAIEGGQVQIGHYRPAARIGFEGQLLLPTVRSVSVYGMNAEVTVLSRKLSLGELAALEGADWPARFAKLEAMSGVKRSTLGRGASNKTTTLPIDLDALLGAGSGAFALGVRFVMEDGTTVTEVKTGQRSRLGLSVKRGRDHGLVWVTSTDSGAPVPGAQVQVWGGKAAAVTDASGVATLGEGQFAANPESQKVDLLEVRAGAEVCLISSRETIGPWRLPVSTDFWGPVRDQALVFAERDLFRPGEKAWIKGYVRRPARTGSQILPAETLTLALTSPEGEVATRLSVQTNAFGSFSGQLSFPLTAQVGGWTIALLRGKQELGSASVAVRHYRPAEFEVQVAPSAVEIGAGEVVDFRVRGSYFFGGAMARAKTKVWVTRSEEYFVPPGSDAFETTDDAARASDEMGRPPPVLSEADLELDPSGQLSQRVTVQLPQQTGPERVTLEAEVTDVSRQALSGRSGVLVHPGSYYVGIRRDGSSFFDVGKPIQPTVATFSPAGKQLVGKSVELELLHLRWAEVEQEMDAGYRRTVRTLVRESAGRCRGMAAGKPLCPLTAARPGQYLLRATSKDDKGRTVRASTWLYALGSGSGSAGFRDDAERGSIEVALDQKQYRPGDRARLLVQSPFAVARAWLTLEREGVLSSRIVELRGPTPVIEIPVTEEMGPNVFVGVHLLEDRALAGAKARPLADGYRFGYAELRLDPELRRLAVEVRTDRAEYRPRDEVTLSVAVRDQARAPSPAEVAIFVVDEGVLSLSGYQLPDPVSAFAGPRPLRVETIEGREGLARLVGLDPSQGGSKGEPGGDGGDARSNFLTAAFFHPGLVTDASGRASVRFRLPDNLGRFRVMAMAVSERDRYGSGRTELTVNRPLMARPALPRFLRAGDDFQAVLVVDSRSAQPASVAVELVARGVTTSGPTTRTVELPARSSVRVEFPARAREVGPATFTFRVKGGAGEDTVTITRPVQLAAPMETVAAYGRTDGARAERLTALEGARPDTGGLEVSVSSSALVGLRGSFEKLEEYPYACTEQLTSRLLPLVAMQGLSRRFAVKGAKEGREESERTLAEILGRQGGDGGFGFWPESASSDGWVSAYALLGLAEAHRQKIPIPQPALERGRRFLEETANVRERERLPEAVFAAFVLGRLGHPDVASLQALFDRRSEMPVFARALLLWGLAEAKHGKAAHVLRREIEGLVTVRGNRAEVIEPQADRYVHYFASSVRLHALVLRALVAADPKTDLAPALVRALLEARKEGAWETTQEAAFSLLALDGYASAQEKLPKRLDATVFLADTELGKVTFDPVALSAKTFSVPMARLRPPTDLVVAQGGDGALFYEARLRFARRALPTEPIEQGFVVERALSTVDPSALGDVPRALQDQDTFAASSLLMSEVTVLVPSRRRFVVIDDPLPAGVEAVDFHLSTSGGPQPTTSPDGYSYAWFREEIRDDRVLYFVDDMPPGLYRYRYLARATTPGRYVTPPTRAMEMYQEEVFGRTGTRTVEVK